MSKRERFRGVDFIARAMGASGRRVKLLCCLAAALVLFVPITANGQYGMDPCCSVMTLGLRTIAQLLTGQVAPPLSDISGIDQQSATFHQQVIYPMPALNAAHAAIVQINGQMNAIQQISSVPVNSATLPGTQQLESVLLSHNSTSIPQVGQIYVNVYGATPSATNAPAPVRNAMDMADAEAQAALKKALQLDALADIETQAANQIMQQLKTAAPGSAPILEAEAAALRIRADAYTQSAVAELVRLKAIELASSSADLKFSAGNTTSLRGNIGGMLGSGAN